MHDNAVVVEATETRAIEGQLRFLDRHVHALPSPRSKAVVHRRQCSDGGIPTGVILSEVGAGLDRGSVRKQLQTWTARKNGPFASRVEGDEVVRTVVGVRPGETERCDDHDGRGFVQSLLLIPGGIVSHHHVEPRRQLLTMQEPFGLVRHDHACLTGIQVQEPASGLAERGIASSRSPHARRVAAGRLQLSRHRPRGHP